ncbi:MAG: hypothetical protein ACYCZO_02570 [Daejeonella sp.]
MKSISIDQKVDELISLLSTSDLDSIEIERLKEKFNNALEGAGGGIYKAEGFLQGYKMDSRKARNYSTAKKAARVFRLVVALLMILLGFGMIIMPAPEYFEMFTLFYLNPNDGVTIMDVISLIVAFTGVSLFISTLIKFNTT